MIAFSCSVCPQDSGGYYWEVKGPERSVIACGLASSDVAARVAAIRAVFEHDEQSQSNQALKDRLSWRSYVRAGKTMPVFGNRFRFPVHETFLLGGWVG